MRIKFTISIIFLVMLTSLSGCYFDGEYAEPHVELIHAHEYETKEIIQQVYERGRLVYEEAAYRAWIDLEFENLGSFTAHNVEAVITLWGNRGTYSFTLFLNSIRPGEVVNISYDTGFDFITDYNSYEVEIYWD